MNKKQIQDFIEVLVSWGRTQKLPTKKLERELNSILFNFYNRAPGVSGFRAVDPGSMQNSLGCDFILTYEGRTFVCEGKRVKTKTLNLDPDYLYSLLEPSQKLPFEKCMKSKTVFLYILYHNDSVTIVRGV